MVTRRELPEQRPDDGLVLPDELCERMPVVVRENARNEIGVGDRHGAMLST